MDLELNTQHYFCFQKSCLKTISQKELQEHSAHNYHSLQDHQLNIDFFRDDLNLENFHSIFSEIAIQQQLVTLTLNLSKSNLGQNEMQHLCLALDQLEQINQLDINLSINSILDSGQKLLIKSLSKLITLQYCAVDVERNGLINSGIQTLEVAASLPYLNVFKLNLCNNRFNIDEVSKLKIKSQDFSKITHFELSFNDYALSSSSLQQQQYNQFRFWGNWSNQNIQQNQIIPQQQMLCLKGQHNNQALFFSSPIIYLFHIIFSQANRLQKLCLRYPGGIIDKLETLIQFSNLFKSMRSLKTLRLQSLNDSLFFYKIDKLIDSVSVLEEMEDLYLNMESIYINQSTNGNIQQCIGNLKKLKRIEIDLGKTINFEPSNGQPITEYIFFDDLSKGLLQLPQNLMELGILCSTNQLAAGSLIMIGNCLKNIPMLRTLKLNFASCQQFNDDILIKFLDPISRMRQLHYFQLNLSNTKINTNGVKELFEVMKSLAPVIISLNLNLENRNVKFPQIEKFYCEAMDQMKFLQKCVTIFSQSNKTVRQYRNKASARHNLLYLCTYMQQCVLKGIFRKEVTWEILEFMINDANNTFYVPI